VWLGFRNWGKCEAEEEENELGFVVGLLYFAGARLVTMPSSGRLPARGGSRSRLGAVLHARDEDEDDLLSQIFDEGVSWAELGCAGPVQLGCWWAATTRYGSGMLFLLFSIFYFLFYIFYLNLI
jgi:hypothetical protein